VGRSTVDRFKRERKVTEKNKRTHDVVVAREQCCRVGVLIAQLHKVGPMMIVIVGHVHAYVRP
jgi:hypothetical protein